MLSLGNAPEGEGRKPPYEFTLNSYNHKTHLNNKISVLYLNSYFNGREPKARVHYPTHNRGSGKDLTQTVPIFGGKT